MKYDDASWHYGGDFPDDLPDAAGGTHIGMFLAWAAHSERIGSLHTDDFSEELAELRQRQVTPGAWFLSACDEKLTDEDFTAEGNAFALSYYEEGYLADYSELFLDEFESTYHVPDTWETFERVKPLLDERFAAFRAREEAR